MTETPTITAAATIAGTPTATSIPTEPTPEPLQNATYTYDGDGNLVKSVINDKSTYLLGKLYQKKINGAVTTIMKYYSSGSAQIAVRTITDTTDTLQWMLSDHLGSTSTTANADGTWNSSISYTAFGEIRASSGLTASDFRYTGQLRQAELGLYYYVARWYDPQTAHFTQADTVVPNAGDAASYDRYTYVRNNPVRYNDPSGHTVCNTCSGDYDMAGGGGSGSSNPETELLDNLVDYTAGIISFPDTPENRKEIRDNMKLFFKLMKKANTQYTKWNKNFPDSEGSPWNSASLAYFFATIRKESEWGLSMFEIEGERREYNPYYGRGFIQLTGKDNYQEMGINFEVDLLNNLDLAANNEELSARIALRFVVIGKTGYQVGKIQSPDDFYGARDMVNSGDTVENREQIANWANGYYQIFETYCNLGLLSTTGSCY
jgi:RHS repeat-associated protein